MSIEKTLKIDRGSLSRPEAIRVTKQDLTDIKERSDENIRIIKGLNKTTDEDKRNIIVNLVGALDYYIHEIVLWGIKAITLDGFPQGKKYDNFLISIKFLKQAIENKTEDIDEIIDKRELREAIIELLKGPAHTYQKWDNIKKGMAIILPTENKLMEELTSGKNGITAKFQTEELGNLNIKRNNIVHHFDRDYNNDSLRNQFNRDINDDIDYIKLIIDSIHTKIMEYEESESKKTNDEETQGEQLCNLKR